MSSSSRQLSDDDAQPLDTLIAMTAKVVSEIRASLEDGRCQLIPAESTYPRIYSLAALSHECVFLEELCKLAVSDAPSDLLALLARHHLETWITGVYLVFGGEEAFAKFRGEADRARLAMQNEIKAMQKTGRMADVDSSALDDDSGWEPQKFAYQRIFEEVDRVGEELGLLRNAKAAYAIPISRPLQRPRCTRHLQGHRPVRRHVGHMCKGRIQQRDSAVSATSDSVVPPSYGAPRNHHSWEPWLPVGGVFVFGGAPTTEAPGWVASRGRFGRVAVGGATRPDHRLAKRVDTYSHVSDVRITSTNHHLERGR